MTSYLTLGRDSSGEVEVKGSRFLCTLRRDLVTEFAITLDHESAGRVESELRARGLVVLDAAYGAVVTLLVGSAAPSSVGPIVAEVTGGSATPERVGERWVDAG